MFVGKGLISGTPSLSAIQTAIDSLTVSVCWLIERKEKSCYWTTTVIFITTTNAISFTKYDNGYRNKFMGNYARKRFLFCEYAEIRIFISHRVLFLTKTTVSLRWIHVVNRIKSISALLKGYQMPSATLDLLLLRRRIGYPALWIRHLRILPSRGSIFLVQNGCIPSESISLYLYWINFLTPSKRPSL